jgi:nicotinate-nucleotide adenylyltransferase
VARVGLLGGTFNPPHLGHLLCASEAWDQLELDRVELLVAGVPPHKAVPEEPGVAHRATMCRLAVADDPRLDVNLVEAERPGPSFTVDTLRELDGSDELTFIVGGDMAHSLPSWREPSAILELAEFGVAEREELRRADIARALGGLDTSRVRFFDMPRLDLSSTEIRRRARAGRALRYIVPEPVAAYIHREGLYKE